LYLNVLVYDIVLWCFPFISDSVTWVRNLRNISDFQRSRVIWHRKRSIIQEREKTLVLSRNNIFYFVWHSKLL